MAYLMSFSHTGIERGMCDGEGERMMLELSWSSTSLLSYTTVSGMTAFAASIKWKKKRCERECFLDYHVIYVSSCLFSESQADL